MKRYKTKLFWIFFMGLFLFFPKSVLQARSLQSHQPVIPMSQMDAGTLTMTVSPAEPFTVDPILEIPTQDQGKVVTLFAIVLNRNWVILMTESGWKPYFGDITMFGKVTLASDTLQPFSLDGGRLISSAGDSIDLFYGYETEQELLLGNLLRFYNAAPDPLPKETFEISQPATTFDNLNPADQPLTAIPNTCNALIPSLSVADADVGRAAQLFAAIFIGEYVIVKTSQGWEMYYGGDLRPFNTVILQKDLSEFELPLPETYDGEVYYYYAYLVNRTDMVGNAMRVNVSE